MVKLHGDNKRDYIDLVTPRFPKQRDFIITIRVNSQTEHYTVYS